MLYREDFLVQFNHVQQIDASVFELLYIMAAKMLEKSNKLQEMKEKDTKVCFSGVYRRMLWSKSHLRYRMYVCLSALGFLGLVYCTCDLWSKNQFVFFSNFLL